MVYSKEGGSVGPLMRCYRHAYQYLQLLFEALSTGKRMVLGWGVRQSITFRFLFSAHIRGLPEPRAGVDTGVQGCVTKDVV